MNLTTERTGAPYLRPNVRSTRSTPPAKWAPVHRRWRAVPGLATSIERWRIRGWDRQLDEYFPLGLDELSVEIADDLTALQEALEAIATSTRSPYAAAEGQYLDWARVRRLERAASPFFGLSNKLAAKYDLVQRRRYEHACETATREIPWDEWTRDNPTSSQLRFGEPSKRASASNS
jgi:hypothetical protein